MNVEENKRLMKTLDDAWNSQDWDTFNKRHHDEVEVYWPGQPNQLKENMHIMLKQWNFLKHFQTTM